MVQSAMNPTRSLCRHSTYSSAPVTGATPEIVSHMAAMPRGTQNWRVPLTRRWPPPRRSRTQHSRQQARDDLETEFRSHALATAAIDALQSATTKLLAGAIAPLTREISSRWKRLFAGRGTITLSVQGALSRDVNGETLPLRSFSTGEKMTARRLLHLLALDAATHAGLCWIDEPPEHLDPDTRRQVASLLAVTPSASGAGQILVTTYEEPLVRRITRRMPGQARLVHVRAGSGS